MRYTDLIGEQLLGIAHVAWEYFQAASRLCETEVLGPIVLVLNLRDMTAAPTEVPHERVRPFLERYINAPDTVPVLIMEVWMKQEPIGSVRPEGPVSEMPGRASALWLTVHFSDGVACIKGTLSHDDPVPGVLRTLSDIIAIGTPPGEVEGRMMPNISEYSQSFGHPQKELQWQQ
mgnify:CR=1 FL=1